MTLSEFYNNFYKNYRALALLADNDTFEAPLELYPRLAIDYQRERFFAPFKDVTQLTQQVASIPLRPMVNLLLAPLCLLAALGACGAAVKSQLDGEPLEDVTECRDFCLIYLGGVVFFPINAALELLLTAFDLMTSTFATIASSCGMNHTAS